MFLKINNTKLNNVENMFIHRNAWFALCDFAYTSIQDEWTAPLDQTEPFNPENVPNASVIYVTPWGIDKFIEEIHPRIKNRYILVTYCYGTIMKYSHIINDNKIIAWFGQTNRDAITFDKFTIMPIGILATNEIFNRRHELINDFANLKKLPKTNLAYMNFIAHANDSQDRTVVFNLFKDKPWCKTVVLTHTWRKPFMEYMDDVARSKFTIAPEGDMHDTYRVHEAIMMGSIPIVHRSPLDKLLEDLPVVIVDDYKEVTEEFLNAKYEEMHNKTYNIKKLYMKHWADLIDEAKKK